MKKQKLDIDDIIGDLAQEIDRTESITIDKYSITQKLISFNKKRFGPFYDNLYTNRKRTIKNIFNNLEYRKLNDFKFRQTFIDLISKHIYYTKFTNYLYHSNFFDLITIIPNEIKCSALAKILENGIHSYDGILTKDNEMKFIKEYFLSNIYHDVCNITSNRFYLSRNNFIKIFKIIENKIEINKPLVSYKYEYSNHHLSSIIKMIIIQSRVDQSITDEYVRFLKGEPTLDPELRESLKIFMGTKNGYLTDSFKYTFWHNIHHKQDFFDKLIEVKPEEIGDYDFTNAYFSNYNVIKSARSIEYFIKFAWKYSKFNDAVSNLIFKFSNFINNENEDKSFYEYFERIENANKIMKIVSINKDQIHSVIYNFFYHGIKSPFFKKEHFYNILVAARNNNKIKIKEIIASLYKNIDYHYKHLLSYEEKIVFNQILSEFLYNKKIRTERNIINNKIKEFIINNGIYIDPKIFLYIAKDHSKYDSNITKYKYVNYEIMNKIYKEKDLYPYLNMLDIAFNSVLDDVEKKKIIEKFGGEKINKMSQMDKVDFILKNLKSRVSIRFYEKENRYQEKNIMPSFMEAFEYIFDQKNYQQILKLLMDTDSEYINILYRNLIHMIANRNVINLNNKLEFIVKMTISLNRFINIEKFPMSKQEKYDFFASLFGKYNNLELYRMICVANELIILESK